MELEDWWNPGGLEVALTTCRSSKINNLFDAIFLYIVTKFDIYDPAVKILCIYKQNKSSTEQISMCPVSITASQS
jgi:hypothetical protein